MRRLFLLIRDLFDLPVSRTTAWMILREGIRNDDQEG
jgi:hypothetical protein